MAKKFLGLSVFHWVLILLVVLFFVYGMGRVSEGFGCSNHSKKAHTNKASCNTATGNCKWKNNACYCCP